MKCVYIIQVTIIVTSLISCSQPQGGDTGENPKDFKHFCPSDTPVRCDNGQCCNSTQYCGVNSDECENCTKLQKSTDNIISRSRGQENTLDFTKLIDAVDALSECRDYFINDISRKVIFWKYNPDSPSTTPTDTSLTTTHSQTDGCEPKGHDSMTMTVIMVIMGISLCVNGIFIVIAIFRYCKLHRRDRQHRVHISTKYDAECAEGKDGGQPTGATFKLNNPRSTDVVVVASDDQGEQTTAMTQSDTCLLCRENPRINLERSDDQEEQTTVKTPSETKPLLLKNDSHTDGPELQLKLKAAPIHVPQSAVIEDRSCGGDVQLACPRPGAQQSIHAQRSNGFTLNPIVSDQGGGNSVLACN